MFVFKNEFNVDGRLCGNDDVNNDDDDRNDVDVNIDVVILMQVEYFVQSVWTLFIVCWLPLRPIKLNRFALFLLL